MSGDDLVVVAHQNRIRKAEPADAVGNLSDLFLRVGARVLRIGLQRRQADGNDVHAEIRRRLLLGHCWRLGFGMQRQM
jgi:hypothetical protein